MHSERAASVQFLGVVYECARNPEFVANWSRLRGIRFGGGSPLDLMIDDATGLNSEIAQQFIADVYDLVWCRLPLPQVDLPEDAAKVLRDNLWNLL